MTDRKSFGQILETLGAPRRDEAPERAFANPLASAAAPIAAEAAIGEGVENLWDHAFAWTTDPAPDAPPASPPPSDDQDQISRELGLTSAATPDQLHRARRRFMWRNHPDRRSDIPADLANRRVAIANMLIDRALAQGGRPA
jgi:hypothetical protein